MQNHALTGYERFLVGLRALASGSYMQSVADGFCVDKRMVVHYTGDVIDAIMLRLFPRIIQWPRDRAACQAIANGFEEWVHLSATADHISSAGLRA